ncbi:hypothetical protein BaRGS_00029860 [Batillaria attramentaria]|uniref:Uncharacterized protein n=1 Tax=Batillaria attramentaria TaxID=370345 RepID=A0ABD0JUX5_9CAEN
MAFPESEEENNADHQILVHPEQLGVRLRPYVPLVQGEPHDRGDDHDNAPQPAVDADWIGYIVWGGLAGVLGLLCDNVNVLLIVLVIVVACRFLW